MTAGCGHRKIFHIFRARSQAAHRKCSAISGLKRNTDVERKRGDVKLKRPKEAGPELRRERLETKEAASKRKDVRKMKGALHPRHATSLV